MKRIVSLFLVFSLCFSLCACGDKKASDVGDGSTETVSTDAKIVYASAVEIMFAYFSDNENVILTMETIGEQATGITLTFNEPSWLKEYLIDKSECNEALNVWVTTDVNDIADVDLRILRILFAVSDMYKLLGYEATYGEVFSVICDGLYARYEGWIISVEVNLVDDNTVTVISAVQA